LRELLATTTRVDTSDRELQDMPLARASLGAGLPLSEGFNPAYTKVMMILIVCDDDQQHILHLLTNQRSANAIVS
jgi:hypothetical protein